MDNAWISAMLLVALGALILGFGMGVNSVKKEIANYGCEAVVKTWSKS